VGEGLPRRGQFNPGQRQQDCETHEQVQPPGFHIDFSSWTIPRN
jgi:hypothetical protein